MMLTAGVKLSFVTAPGTGCDEAWPLSEPGFMPAWRSAAARIASCLMRVAGATGEVQNALVIAAPPVAVNGVPMLISVCARNVVCPLEEPASAIATATTIEATTIHQRRRTRRT